MVLLNFGGGLALQKFLMVPFMFTFMEFLTPLLQSDVNSDRKFDRFQMLQEKQDQTFDFVIGMSRANNIVECMNMNINI